MISAKADLDLGQLAAEGLNQWPLKAEAMENF